jgi:hypothetical protein
MKQLIPEGRTPLPSRVHGVLPSKKEKAMKKSENTGMVESFLLGAISHYNTLRTASSLGDRSAYLGASDIAGAFGCERRVLLNKFGSAPVERHPESALVLERGHWIEEGLGAAVNARVRHTLFGLSITTTTPAGTPIVVHPDLVCVCKSKVLVFEVKSVSSLPEKARVEHLSQLQMQIGLLDRLWSRDAFTTNGIRDAVSFPSLVRSRFMIDLPERKLPVIGYVVYVTNNELRTSPAQHPQDSILQVLLNKGDRLWSLKDNPEQGAHAKGIYPLCEYCAHHDGCPAFQSTDVPELAGAIAKYREATDLCKAADALKKRAAEELKSFASAPGFIGKWLTAGDGEMIKVSRVPGKISLNQDKLVEILMDRHWFTEDMATRLLDDASDQGDDYLRLTQSRAKPKAPEQAESSVAA